MKVLILSVGSSDAPLVRCIQTYRPEYIIFLCSEDNDTNKGSRIMVDGAGVDFTKYTCKQCSHVEREQRPNIVDQCGISREAYEVHLVPPDDPYKNYEVAVQLIASYLENGHEVIVDYTGGTKSMSVGLSVAAMEFPDCRLSVVKGKRLDLVKVRDGMERVSRLPFNVVFINRQMRLSESLVKNWDYQGAVQVLDEIDRLGYVGDEKDFERSLFLCRGFAAWDKFDYWNAAEKISIYKDEPLIAEYNKRLKQICAVLDWYDNWVPGQKNNPPVFVLAYDVLLNSERRAAQGKYDDAISRIYRGLEMYGQFCLRTGDPALTSDNIDVSLLPEDCREVYEKKRNEKGKIQVGLRDNFDLLAALGHPVKPVWKERKERIINTVLERRNNSFLAHGLNPLSQSEYEEVREVVWDFISECDNMQGIKEGLLQMQQFPVDIF